MKILMGYIWLILIVSPSLYACSCVSLNKDPIKDIQLASFYSDAIFIGQVKNILDLNKSQHITGKGKPRLLSSPKLTTFKVIKLFKGPKKAKQIQTKIDTACCICGYDFMKDKTYLVYANKLTGNDKNYYTVSTCSRTRLLEKAKEDIKVLTE